MFAGFCIVQHEAAAGMLPLCVLETRREEGLSHERTGNHCWCCSTADQRCSDHYLHDAGAEAAERHCCTDWCKQRFVLWQKPRTHKGSTSEEDHIHLLGCFLCFDSVYGYCNAAADQVNGRSSCASGACFDSRLSRRNRLLCVFRPEQHKYRTFFWLHIFFLHIRQYRQKNNSNEKAAQGGRSERIFIF